MQSGEKIARGLLVARRDGSKMFDYIEETLDEIAFAVEREIAIAFEAAIGFGRDDYLDPARRQAIDEAIGVISFVGEQGFGLDKRRERLGLADVVHLPARETERQRIAQGVDDDMDFCREPPARAANGLVDAPFLRAPALCWWARTIVASIIAYSLSGSSAKALKRLSQTPLTAHREKRLCVLHQPPKRSGKSRHGAPTRNFQITASTNRRLPRSLLRPTVPGRPGSKFSIRANCSSRNACRSIKSLLQEGFP